MKPGAYPKTPERQGDEAREAEFASANEQLLLA
jgi:hypothetical protein